MWGFLQAERKDRSPPRLQTRSDQPGLEEEELDGSPVLRQLQLQRRQAEEAAEDQEGEGGVRGQRIIRSRRGQKKSSDGLRERNLIIETYTERLEESDGSLSTEYDKFTKYIDYFLINCIE